ncbi:MAG: LuxR C-terminal-related transcriptional regulator [Acidobacteriota bacterium]|jgi:DNA-binding NarL/FixJ family response regulator|nr:response regulator transcription factor [Acidobacteriaceae bacterium]
MQPQTIASWAEAEGRYEILFYPASAPSLDEPLSPRELEVAKLVANGLSSKIIAHKLGISNWTVCTHLRRTFSKLGVTTRAAMVARLHQTGSLR